MNILVVSATKAEIEPLLIHFNLLNQSPFCNESSTLGILETGVGMVATAYSLGKAVANETPDLVINAGISGAIDRTINLGEVVHVFADDFFAFGAEDGESFIPATLLGFREIRKTPVTSRFAVPELRNVTGITVQTVHGSEAGIEKLKRLAPDAQVETMEGAAAQYACTEAGIPFIQIRAISNYVERRNREAWQIQEAVAALNSVLITYISGLIKLPSSN